MSFIPRIEVTISNNRCRCCDDDASKAQPKELSVFYSPKDQRFHARLTDEQMSSLKADLIQSTQKAVEDFLAKTYLVQSNEIPENYKKLLATRLPSLEDIYDMERVASEMFSQKSSHSIDSIGELSRSPDKKERRYEKR